MSALEHREHSLATGSSGLLRGGRSNVLERVNDYETRVETLQVLELGRDEDGGKGEEKGRI